MMMQRVLGIALGCVLLAGPAPAGERHAGPRFELTSRSAEAKELLRKLQHRIESLQFGPQNEEIARRIVAVDSEFALGTYYLSAVTPPPDNQKHLEKAVELSRNASDGERRFIEAMVVARGNTPEHAIEPLRELARDYPGERLVFMLLGQVSTGANRVGDARAAYEKAIAIDGSTPRAYSFLANLQVLEGRYADARGTYDKVLNMMAPGTAPGQVRYGTAFTYLYEGKVDAALKSLNEFIAEYKAAGQPFGIPEVFIWNSMARIHLENGRPEQALEAYEKGYQSVPASGLDETQKKIWLGRLHHGRGRALARLGRHAEAWKEAETIRKLIDEGGEQGKQFEPAYHYLVGYLKLEKGDLPAAIEHLKQADPQDPFHKLLLARAYEKAGDKASARKAYQDVVNSGQNSIERALAYPEARRRLQSL
jgi:tetratricopeptide (TPR) repeat protein